MDKQKKWVMPKWMEKYRSSLHNTGGNTVEKLMNYKPSEGGGIDPLGVLSVCVSSQVGLLETLHKNNKLCQK